MERAWPGRPASWWTVCCESSVVRLGLSARLAAMLAAPCYRLDELEAGAGLAAMARHDPREGRLIRREPPSTSLTTG